MIDVTTTAIVVAATSALGVLRLLLTLLFLWKVYTRGGRQDLTAAARALRDARTPRLSLPTSRRTSSAAVPGPATNLGSAASTHRSGGSPPEGA